MGMIAHFCRIDSATLEKLRADDSLLESYLYGDDETPANIDIEKAWHGLHYLLTANNDNQTLAETILGGEGFGQEMDYGPARLLDAPLVADIAAALDQLDEAALSAAYAPQAMQDAGIYPEVWVDEGQEALDYLLIYYRTLQAFYRTAAANGEAVLTWLG